LDSADAHMLLGTEKFQGSWFWSFDSRFIAFCQDGRLKKIDVSGGPASTIVESIETASRGGSWNQDGVLLMGSGKGIMRVSLKDGMLSAATVLDPSGKD